MSGTGEAFRKERAPKPPAAARRPPPLRLTGSRPAMSPHNQAIARISHLPDPGLPADRALWAAVIRQARCAASGLDADQWFPVSAEPAGARREAAAALALCQDCPVRVPCLELSLRQWDVGQHGIWGGLVAAERATLRRRILAGP